MSTGQGGNIAEKIWERSKNVIEDLGYVIWDVKYLKEGADWYLRVVIDNDEGISLEDCELVHRTMDPLLDDWDLIKQAYHFEVQSPGIERELTRDFHFEILMGEEIKIKTIRKIDNANEFTGILKGYENGNITIEVDGEDKVFNKKEASSVRLCDFGGF